MKKSKFLKVSAITYILSILSSFLITFFAPSSASAAGDCYRCSGANCVTTSGSGWTHCLEGSTNCGLGGSSCSIVDDH